MRRGMRRVHGPFRLGVCAAVLVAGSARAESYRLVEPTLRAPEIQHGHLEVQRKGWSSNNLTGIWLMGGAGELGFEELDAELARHGWSTVGLTETTFGLGFTTTTGPWYAGLVFEGAPHDIVGPNGESGNVGVSRFSVQLGWQAYFDGKLSLAPFFGIGISSINVLGQTDDPRAFPLFSGQVRTQTVGFEVQRSTGLLEVGVGAQTFVPALGTRTQTGPAVGVQLGYRGGFAQGDWHDDVRDLGIHDPEALQDGFFVRLLVGWAWSVGQTYTVIERVERCTKPDCWVRCERRVRGLRFRST